MTGKKPSLRLLEFNAARPAAGLRPETRPITALRQHPVAHICEQFAVLAGPSKGVLQLLRVVGSDAPVDLTKRPEKHMRVNQDIAPHELGGLMHLYFCAERLAAYREQLSEPGQVIYDALQFGATEAWTKTSAMSERRIYQDPATGRLESVIQFEDTMLSYEYPRADNERDITFLPALLQEYLFASLREHEGDIVNKTARAAAGYTESQRVKDDFLLTRRILPVLTHYPPAHQSYLLDELVHEQIDMHLHRTLNEAREISRRKTGAEARYPQGRAIQKPPTATHGLRLITKTPDAGGPT